MRGSHVDRMESCTSFGWWPLGMPIIAITCALPAVRHPTCCGRWPWPIRWPWSPTAREFRPVGRPKFCCWRSLSEMGSVPMIDGFGRIARDLRISVTDRCNFRCQYCMPEEGMQWLPREEILTFDDIERVARLGVERFV